MCLFVAACMGLVGIIVCAVFLRCSVRHAQQLALSIGHRMPASFVDVERRIGLEAHPRAYAIVSEYGAAAMSRMVGSAAVPALPVENHDAACRAGWLDHMGEAHARRRHRFGMAM